MDDRHSLLFFASVVLMVLPYASHPLRTRLCPQYSSTLSTNFLVGIPMLFSSPEL